MLALMEKREEMVKSLREMLRAAEEENRALSAEEKERFDQLSAELEQINQTLERQAKVRFFENQLERVEGESPAKIGMPEKDARRYSLVRAIRAAATGNWRGAELEREASEEVARRLGREPRSFFVPYDFLDHRDLVKGTPSAGGYTVATELLAQNFIEMLRNRMALTAAGATVLSGLVGDIAIPGQSGGATAYWVAENGAITESQQTFRQVAMQPRTVGALTEYSRKLLLQSSIDVEAFVRRDLATTLALAIDYAALHGDGTNNSPTGVANTTGIGVVAIGADGGAPTWDHIVDLETEVAQDNADIGSLAYITNAKVRGKLKRTPKVSGQAIFIWEDGQFPLNGYRAIVSNQVRSDLTKGSGTNLSAIFFGNWSDLMIGQWGTLDILVDPYSNSASGAVRVVVFQDVDVAVRHPESFAAVLDAVTS